ncbi:MAG: hypothetical protein AB8G77_18535 [Rhodothermales bacterium]
MKNFKLGILAISTLLLFSGCKLADLQTQTLKRDGLQEEQIAKGKSLLTAAWKAQGMDKLTQYTTYSVVAEDHWRGLMGKMGKVWPESRSEIELKYAINTFDSQVTFLNGKEEGLMAGLQSWQYYEQEAGGIVDFKDKADKKIRFGLSAFQYFFELGDRLKQAPIITAIGQKEREDILYDQVFITWEKTDAHMEHDQYVVWINTQSNLIEYAEFTIRDTYLKVPGYKKFYGSIRFSDFKEINGIKIPFTQHIFLNSPKKDRKYLHKLTVSTFNFDTFALAELHPDKELKLMGDEKVW